MPLVPTVKMDASSAIATFDARRGIPVNVRNAMRVALVDLTKRVGAKVEANLDSGLRSRTSLTVKKELIENEQGVTGRVTTVSSANPMLPVWLEEGTRPHEIRARNAKALSFFWERVGRNVMFRKVMHPGFAGIHYTQNAFSDMESEIRSTIRKAMSDGLGTRR